VVLGELGLRGYLGVVLLPGAEKVEEGRGRHERVRRSSRDLVLRHVPLALPKRLQCELFAVCARGNVVQQRVFARHVCLGLLQLLHQVGRVDGAFCVGRVQPGGDDLVDDVEAY
jgi:hypothetical protein